MFTTFYSRIIALMISLSAYGQVKAWAANPFVGDWELSLPNNAAGWLGVEEASGGMLSASIMMVAGSVVPVAEAKIEDGRLILTREHQIELKDAAKTKKTILEKITASISGNNLRLLSVKPREEGNGEDRIEFTGKRTPPMPPAPDLTKVKFGTPFPLFNGLDLTGWRLTDPKADNGWIVEEGKLVNKATNEEGKPHKHYGNLRTDREFEDFNLKLDVRVFTNGNSGIYLRGIYEVQVEECYGQPPTTHNMAAIYSRIQPSQNASKPAGEWQKFDITLVDRHVTVVLNGVTVIDNQPVRGCTGGALWSDVTRPGPIYLQGDHTSSEYRNIVLRSVLKRGRLKSTL
jgi:hypothetical protein